jgi:WD40-like Beta Propeller Repeat
MVRQLTLRKAGALVALGAGLCSTLALALPNFSDWAPPANIETLPFSANSVNTPAVDGCVSLSRDGLTLAFNSNRGGNQDIYLATRASSEDGFGTPEALPEPINTAADEFCPTIALGNRLYFSRNRTGDPGDLYVSREGPNGWGTATRLGGDINSPLMEESPAFYEDEQGLRVMLFSRRPATGTGGAIFASTEGGPAVPVAVGPGANNCPSITHDGLAIFFDSVRPGGLGGPDLYVATRAATSEPFGSATHLTALSLPGFDARPSISWDGRELLFSSIRPGGDGGPDIWWTSRSKAPSGPRVITF